MTKKKFKPTDINQISLFDQFFNTQINNTNGNEPAKSITEAQLSNDNDSIGRESGTNDIISGGGSTSKRTGENGSSSDTNVGNDGNTETRNFQINEGKPNLSALSNKTRRPDELQSETNGMGGNANEFGSGTLPTTNERRNRSSVIGNFKIDETAYAISHKNFNKKRKYEANTQAIELLITLLKENRKADGEEQKILANYVGFGGLKEILLDPLKNEHWNTESNNELKGHVTLINDVIKELGLLLNTDLLGSARSSILSSFYTSPDIIKGIYYTIDKIGFKQGNILEPSAGVGNFIGMLNPEMAAKSKITAVELDKISGNILSHLYPTANVYNQGFQVTPIEEKSIDLIISNVPFGNTQIFDRSLHTNINPLFKEASNNIHNYYFAKSLLLAKENGIIAFITSRYTLDNSDNTIRKLIAEEAEFLGAIRLGDNAFKGNAGTQVVTDIIFLRKFYLGEDKKQKFNFLETTSIEYTDANNINGKLNYNQYYHDNPTHLLGTVEFGGLYNKDSFNLKGSTNFSYFNAITTIADNLFPKPIIKEVQTLDSKKVPFLDANIILPGKFESYGTLVKIENGTIGNIDSGFYINPEIEANITANYPAINTDKIRSGNYSNDDVLLLNNAGYNISDLVWRIVKPIKINQIDYPKVDAYIKIRNSLKMVIFYESNGYDDHFINKERENLKDAYLRFISKFGRINIAANAGFKKYDGTDFYLVASLEKLNPVTKELIPADILEKRTISPKVNIETATNLQDAINISMDEFGYPNADRISILLDKPFDEIIKNQNAEDIQLFINPSANSISNAYVVRSEYLSGEVIEKYKAAQHAFINNPLLEVNITQLQAVQPIPINAVDIYAPLNASWIPIEYLIEFVKELTKINNIEVKYSRTLNNNSLTLVGYHAELENYKTARRDASWVIEHALNGIEPVVKYTETTDKRQVVKIDAVDTTLAKENYKNIVNKWDDWKYKTSQRRTELSKIYNDKYNTSILRDYTGAGKHILLPGLIGYNPRDHQKDAIYRFTQTMGGITDHRVGAGKTLIQCATAMELKRLGRANKPCIIGLKSQVPQFYIDFKKAYPLSNVLFPRENDFTKENRPKLLNSIATNNWDCIIMSHEQFGMIEQPIEIKIELINELVNEMESERLSMDNKDDLKRLENRILNYKNKIIDLLAAKKDNNVLNFKELGIDFLIVDECQEFKNLEYTTRQTNVRGLGNPKGSKRAFNMLVTCRYLQKLHKNDKGIIFCSGTPLSNSMAELYLLFKYLTPKKLAKQGFDNFDLWAANYANSFSELEYSLGKFKNVVRFREFVNLPELIRDYRTIADIRNANNLKLIQPTGIHNLFKVEPNETQLLIIKKLMAFIDTKGNAYREELGLTAGYDAERMMNPTYGLLSINLAKKLSLDPRLINKNLEGGSKIPSLVDEVTKVFNDSNHYKGTQLIFCDIGTPKSTSNVENLYNHLEEIDTPVTDILAIFGELAIETGKFESTQKTIEKMKVVLEITENECNAMLIEANQNHTFNVYNEVKLSLIKKGIPEEQIKFIHDCNNRQQKEELYKNVNDGTVRILIGSTRKMGTGINVQQKICALHHLDVCWKPSDMEQRNGRGERQGNLVAAEFLNSKLPINYFATNRTLDASMYNVVNLKAKFIAQIKTDNVTVRSMSDVGLEELDMGAFSAELSGDPIHKEKATLNKRVSELKLLKNSYQNKAFQIQDSIKTMETLIPYYSNKIEGLISCLPCLTLIPYEYVADTDWVKNSSDCFEENSNWENFKAAFKIISKNENFVASQKSISVIAEISDVTGSKIKMEIFVPYKKVYKFQAIVSDVEYTQHLKAGKEMINHIAFLKLTNKYVDNKIATVWGFDVIARTLKNWSGSDHIGKTVIAPNGTMVGIETAMPYDEVALSSQIQNTILNIPKEIKDLEEKLISSKTKLEGLISLQIEGFPYSLELETKSQRLSEVDNLIVKMIEAESLNNKEIVNDTNYEFNDDFIPDYKPKKSRNL